jgi:pimeloyl-ACP methyl ester carboxylesterase
MKTICKYPEKIFAYVGVGQIINDSEQQKLSYGFIVEKAEKSGNKKSQIAIKAMGPPPYDTPDKINKKDGYIFRYGGVIYKKKIIRMVGNMVGFLCSPEYSLSEGWATFTNKGFKFTSAAMWDDMRRINLTKESKSINVPVYFFEGKYDMATPTVLVEKFYDSLDAKKGKTLIIFENSAHLPMIEEKDKYQELLINLVLREAGTNGPR